ncbi:OmpA family protein [Marixanthomonas spongiae]|uniref:Flagellar motor protein MotB n=1 Tax=Marixanthomonas spongiae TaxID=2174845 RepID=A0A2U0HVF9_9FLAO|nr:OmpA family protein [Marixanthomonas spongiae]PVW12835.1 flagellar motor protein MotB [Marixanthomonas spongiae]
MKLLIQLSLILFVSTCYSQASLNKAERLFKKNAFKSAATTYNEYIENADKVSEETLLQAAEANYNVNNNRKAAMLYERAYNMNANLDEENLYRYVRSLRSVREYKKADRVFLQFLENNDKPKVKEQFIKERDSFYALLNSSKESRYTISNSTINSEYSDFGPVLYRDSLIFSSSRPGAAKELYLWNEQPFLSLFVSEKAENGMLEKPTLFSKQIKSDFHDATIAFAPNSHVVYFTSSHTEKHKLILDNNRSNQFVLYKATMEDGKIKNKEELFFNSKEYSAGHPSVSPDGTFLFFASDMPGGYGQADIYYSEIYKDGMLSEPKNAGPTINTAGNDFFPFLASDGSFYFSSNGHVGFGGLDIFEASFNNATKSFSDVKNIGKVANTSYDDFSIVFDDDVTSGYFASNRPDGKGDDDIYHFTRKPLTCNQVVSGNIKDQKDNNNLADVTVTVRDSTNAIIHTLITDANGNFKVTIPCNNTITLTATKPDYFEQTKDAQTGNKDQGITDPVNFILEKATDMIVKDEEGFEKIKMDPIYFEYDKANITPQAAKALDGAVKLMNFYPNMVIKIEAHTDSRGSDSYNLSLSDKRAKATQEYLYSKGIATNRILSAKGFGESRLLNKCSNGVKCSDEEHEKNRRSNFIILEK